ncbi:hypothetical protein TKK_0016391 [Trichogramma kaykai]|uniref:Uncharacterized protein n=1 Tax=Trichogramma kaykai TaxID=54128 RepID=A0ABD2W6L5_9HYME
MSLERLRSLRENVNWKWKHKRYRLLDRIYSLIENWRGLLPRLQDVFLRKEIDWLLQADVRNRNIDKRGKLVEFAIKIGYKDEMRPRVDAETGRIVTRRTTPLHHAARRRVSRDIFLQLFQIYDRFDVSYRDEFGRTHFYVAYEFDCHEIVTKFLELREVRRTPSAGVNYRAEYPRLHLALFEGRADEAERLLREGADPNLANERGLTPLHVICKRESEGDGSLIQRFFEVVGEMRKTVRVDAKDGLGYTALHYAVANFMPITVDALADRGADLADFVFPTEAFVMNYAESSRACTYAKAHLKALFDALQVLDRLVVRHYDLEQNDTLYLMEVFAKHEHPLVDSRTGDIFYQNIVHLISAPLMHAIGRPMLVLEPSLARKILGTRESLDASWRQLPSIRSHRLTLYDCLRLPTWRLRQLFVEFRSSHGLAGCDSMSITLMCERARRRFFRRWAEFFLFHWDQWMPMVCCEKIIEHLSDADLLNVGRAATGQYYD